MDYKNWLADLKLRLSIADTIRDNILLEYLQIAHINIWKDYYRLSLNPAEEIPMENPWAQDSKTKMATLHLAVTFFSNPDINLEARDVKDDRMIQRIIGSRMGY